MDTRADDMAKPSQPAEPRPLSGAWMWLVAAGLCMGAIGLQVGAHAKFARLRRDQARQVAHAAGLYRSEADAIVGWGRPAPAFAAPLLLRPGSRTVTLGMLRKGARGVIVAFLGSDSTASAPLAAELWDLQDRLAGRGLRVVAFLESPGDRMDPPWLLRALPYPVLRDPGGRVARSYGVHRLPAGVLIAPSGRVCATDVGFQSAIGGTFLRLETVSQLDPAAPQAPIGPLLRLGDPVPDFVADRGGRPFRSQDLKGRWTLLVLSMNDCPGCTGLEDRMRPAVARVRRRSGRTVWANLGTETETSALPDVFLRDPLLSVQRVAAGLPMPHAFIVDPAGVVRAEAGQPLDESRFLALAGQVGREVTNVGAR